MAFSLLSGQFRDDAGRSGTRLARLITRRSQVQILPPLLRKPPNSGVSVFHDHHLTTESWRSAVSVVDPQEYICRVTPGSIRR